MSKLHSCPYAPHPAIISPAGASNFTCRVSLAPNPTLAKPLHGPQLRSLACPTSCLSCLLAPPTTQASRLLLVAATVTPGHKGQISSLLCPNLNSPLASGQHSAPKTALKAALLMPRSSLASPLTSHSSLPTALTPSLRLKALLPTPTRLSPSAPPHPLKSHLPKEVSFRPRLAPHSPSRPGGMHGHSGLQQVLHWQHVAPYPQNHSHEGSSPTPLKMPTQNRLLTDDP